MKYMVVLILMLQKDTHELQVLFKTGILLVESAKPQDCSTAAYLLRFLVHSYSLTSILCEKLNEIRTSAILENIPLIGDGENTSISLDMLKISKKEIPETLCEDNPSRHVSSENRNVRYLLGVKLLHCMLLNHLEVAKDSLMQAAATCPMYPTLHCMRYLLNDVDFIRYFHH